MLGSKEKGKIHFFSGNEKIFYKVDDTWIWETMRIFINKDEFKGIPRRETISV